MKNIIKIFKKDLKCIFTNWVAVVVIVALMAIPSLYSLVNIKANWDPYGNTSKIKIAVINNDKGTNFKEKDINLGKQLVDKLKENDAIGWEFINDKEEAKNNLIMEKYYATIEIPDDFSESVTTLVEKDVRKPKLIYTVNEKTNAVVPKITDTAVKTVKLQLDENIIKTVSGILFRVCNEVGIDIQDNRPELRRIMDATYELDENMPKIEQIIDASIDGTVSASELLEKTNSVIPNINDMIQTGNEFIIDSQERLDDIEQSFNDDVSVIKENLVSTESTLDNCEVILKNIDENSIPDMAKKSLIITSDSLKAVKVTNSELKNKLKSINKFIRKVDKVKIPKPEIDENIQNSQETVKLMEAYNEQVKILNEAKENLRDASETINSVIDRLDIIDEQLEKGINRVNNDLEDLESGKFIDKQELTDMRKILADIHTLVSDTIDCFDFKFVSLVNDNIKTIKDLSDQGSVILGETKDAITDVQNITNTFSHIMDMSNDELLKLKEKMPDIRNQVHKLAEKFKEFDNESDIDDILEVITNDWNSQSEFLSNPIEIEDNRLYPIPNYGSAVTPFYTILCLWVGGYMLSILLGTEVHELDDGTQPKHYEVYFGKMLLFLFIGVFQAIIASLGAIFLLQCYILHPIMFVFYTIFVSVVFMVMIYTAVSLFGHGGIVFGIVLLVMQVAGTSGNFPIEVNPRIYQILFPYMPFTYAISGMRQIMMGIVYSVLLKDLKVLLCILIGSLIIGGTCKKFTNKYTDKFTEKLRKSKFMVG
ncbi:MAG: YhgE/Pip domain-containing protein [Clostridium butyricum]|nr:YhgE/Pip domain-containing protein [Clostridium butyricum]